MVGPWPLAPHHDHLQYIHHIHLMQRGQNRGITSGHRSLLHLWVHYEKQSQRLHSAHIFLAGSHDGLVLDILQVPPGCIWSPLA